MRTCDETWAALDENFKTLMDCLGQLTEEELTTTKVVGGWTVKDVVSHVWSWDEEAVHTIHAWLEPRPWQEGVTYDDAWSEAQTAARSALPLLTVVDGITGSHRRLMHQLDILDEEQLSKVGHVPWDDKMPLMDFFYSMAEHYAEHVADLRAYQERCLEGCD
jgi:hypothetical protein